MTRTQLAARLDELDAIEAATRGAKARVRGHKADGPLVPKLAPALLKAWHEGWKAEDVRIGLEGGDED